MSRSFRHSVIKAIKDTFETGRQIEGHQTATATYLTPHSLPTFGGPRAWSSVAVRCRSRTAPARIGSWRQQDHCPAPGNAASTLWDGKWGSRRDCRSQRPLHDRKCRYPTLEVRLHRQRLRTSRSSRRPARCRAAGAWPERRQGRRPPTATNRRPSRYRCRCRCRCCRRCRRHCCRRRCRAIACSACGCCCDGAVGRDRPLGAASPLIKAKQHSQKVSEKDPREKLVDGEGFKPACSIRESLRSRLLIQSSRSASLALRSFQLAALCRNHGLIAASMSSYSCANTHLVEHFLHLLLDLVVARAVRALSPLARALPQLARAGG